MDNAIILNPQEVEQLDLTDAAEGDTVTLTCSVTSTDNSGLTLSPQSGEVEESGENGEGDGAAAPASGDEDEGPPPTKNPAIAALLIKRGKK
jgi:hypothetical protein